MLPDSTETTEILIPTLTYAVQNSRILSMTDGLAAMVQAVDKILRTGRFSATYLSMQYGNDIDTLIGKPMDYVKSDLSRVITEALNSDDRILNVEISDPVVINKSSLSVSISIETIFGDIQTQTEVNV